MVRKPAVLGGPPAYPSTVPVARPTLDVDDGWLAELSRTLDSGIITNGRQVRALEAEVAEYLRVPEVVAVSNCTTGLLLVLCCLDLDGTVVLPSFTFMATGHAVVWNGLAPAFADTDARTWTVDPTSVAAALVPDSSAILPVHTFGVPSDVDSLAELGRGYGIPVVVDAAHAFGSRYPDGSAVGSKGLAEVFSLSPTKPLSAGEGGLVTTHDGRLAGRLRLAREYGNAGDYDSRLVGLNGRMTEMQALLGRANLRHFPDRLAGRQRLVERYRNNLAGLPGVGFQEVPRGASSVYKDFAISVDPTGFGLSRDQLARCLAVENVATRPYFCPPVHRQTAYREVRPTVPLDTSERLAVSLLTLPLYSHMEVDLVDGISEAVASIQAHAEQIVARPAG